MSDYINIVIVEDYKPLCDMFVYYLSNNGYSAIGVGSASELDEYFEIQPRVFRTQFRVAIEEN